MKYLESITDRFLGDMSSLVWGFAVILVVALLLGALHRFLQRNPGHRFRNQSTMFVAIIVGLLLIILLLPMSTQTRGQLLQLTGIVISAAIALSGGTFIANAMAGVMLKSVRNFRTGDWLEMEGVWGRVSDRGLFHTEVQTPDRDLTTLPNLLLATQAVKVVRASGTIVGATVSLGYDVHHNRCEKLLLEAANSLGLQDPFVQILDLGDYSVTYRVAGLLTETKQLIAFRSRLRAAILDSLHEGGVEIVSPLFNNARQMPTDSPIIPRPEVRDSRSAADAAPVDVVFDKAEEAEGLSSLEAEVENLDLEIKEAKKALKELDDTPREAAEVALKAKENRLAHLREQLAAKEAAKTERPSSET
ncbi:mechanosensitive ion channel protein MscS [bacterium DOLZORAL124_64_63]|nr:MAG: mechanosensitive ion channel protein MscS [bacterium DOLZORAL124_64_63]